LRQLFFGNFSFGFRRDFGTFWGMFSSSFSSFFFFSSSFFSFFLSFCFPFSKVPSHPLSTFKVKPGM